MAARYHPEWEVTWPWLSKIQAAGLDTNGIQTEDRAFCNWCKTDVESSASKISEHEQSHLHLRNAELVSQDKENMELDEIKQDESKKYADNEQEVEVEEDEKRTTTVTPKKGREYGMDMDNIPTPTIFDMLAEQPLHHHQSSNFSSTNGYPRSTDKTSMQEMPPPPAPHPDQVASHVEEDTSMSEDSILPDSSDSLEDLSQQPLQDIKSGIEVTIAEGEETVPLEKIIDMKMEFPSNGEIPMCTLKANAQHPDWFQQHLTHALTTGVCFDAVWQCEGGLFRVHKFVLAAFSNQLKLILPDSEVNATIFTPDLTKDMVKAMLCVMYTGQARIPLQSLEDINHGFKLIGFAGADLSAEPHTESDADSEIQFNYTSPPVKQHPIDVEFPGKQDPEAFEGSTRLKQEPRKLIKIELEDNQEHEANQYYDQNYYEDDHEIEPKRRRSYSSRKPKRIKKDLDEDFELERHEIEEEPDILPEPGRRKRGRPRRDKLDKYYQESRTTYPIHKNRGTLSRRLVYDLFEDRNKADRIRSISVCPVCFKLFDDREKMRDHKFMHHNTDVKGVPSQNSMILGKNTYQCKKCEKTLELKHLVWFVKHYKFCGKDEIKANEILNIDDVEDMMPIMDPVPVHKNSRDIDVMYVNDRPKLMNISRSLLGKVAETIWGCRKCYSAFETEDEYNEHINSAHEGKVEHGTCWDPETKVFSCKSCKVFKTAKSIHYFMYHMKKCNVDVQGVVPIDDEEDVDEDTYYEFVDPWGIVNKPLKVRTMRSKWICESLFGQLYAMLFPCHLCYNVFKSDEEVREHFRSQHPGLQNFMEHGPHYNKDSATFTCPVCKREVCKKQRNSIYFTYHMRKCDGKLFTVTKSCNKCQKSFSSFRSLQFHIQTKCGTVDSVCHICGMVIKTLDGLQKHVMITHSEARPYPCKVCNKAFKRAPDLDYHMKLHMGSLDWSCETCGKAFPLKKNLKIHMTTHLSEADKPHVCHICGNRFARKPILVNHLTTHSSFRGFSCEVCNAQVKTKDSLKQHRRKVHKLYTPIPESCILEPEPNSIDYMKLHPKMDRHKNNKRKRPPFIPGMLGAHHDPNVQVKEEDLPTMLHGEGLEGLGHAINS